MAAEYDELQVLYQYLSFHKQAFMTPLEIRADSLGLLREKAVRSTNERIQKELLQAFEAEVDDEVLDLIGDNLADLLAFRERVAERIKDDAANGRLTLNRCPRCNRIVRTPKARQCRWCGYDWHATA